MASWSEKAERMAFATGWWRVSKSGGGVGVLWRARRRWKIWEVSREPRAWMPRGERRRGSKFMASADE